MAKQRVPLKLKGATVLIDTKFGSSEVKCFNDQITVEGGKVVSEVSSSLSYLLLHPSRNKAGRSQTERAVAKANKSGASIGMLDPDEFFDLVLPTSEEAVLLLRGSPTCKERLGHHQPARREKHLLTIENADLRKVDLSGLFLICTEFRNVDLRGANLEGATLLSINNVQLDGARLDGVTFLSAKNCTFDGLSLRGAFLYDLEECTFRDCDLTSIDNYTPQTWKRCDFSGANFDRSSLILEASEKIVARKARQTTCHFYDVRLPKADLTEADLRWIDLLRADLSGANLNKANLSEAHLVETNFNEADLRGADLSYTNLTGADLHGAKIKGADFTGANLHNANLEGLNLKSAKGLVQASQPFESGPNLHALEKLCKKDEFYISADMQGEGNQRAHLEIRTRKAPTLHFSTQEESHSTLDHPRWAKVLSSLGEAMRYLVCKHGKGELIWDSIVAFGARSKKEGLKELALAAWCEALGIPALTGEDLKQAKAAQRERSAARRADWITRLRTEKEAVEAWNRLTRTEQFGIGTNFSCDDFSNVDLPGIQLRWIHAEGGDFRNTNLQGATFADARLASVKFRGANLQNSTLDGCDLSKADLSKANLQSARLHKTNLREANLRGADLRNANLRDANLRAADLTGAKLTDADVQGARFDEKTKLPKGFAGIEALKWLGKGSSPQVKTKKKASPPIESINFDEFMVRVRALSDSNRLTKSLRMLKAERFHLFSEVGDDAVTGVVRSQTNKDLVYACRLNAKGDYTCCTQNLNACGGLQGMRPCKHLLVLLIGLTKSDMLDCGKASQWLKKSVRKGAKIDKDALGEVFLKYKGVETGEVDWRPTETIPEDFYAL